MMNGEIMKPDEDDTCKKAAFRRSTSCAGGKDGGARSSNTSDFSSAMERILATLEERGDYHKPNHGPVSPAELSMLSILCTLQQQRYGTTLKIAESSTAENDGSDNGLEDYLGFADVDTDTTLQIVEYLERNVSLASGVNLVQSAFQEIQRIDPDGGRKNVDQVRLIR
jgi:hypothetical protein